VNETLDQRLAVRMPRGYLQRCYELAKRFFPAQARLFVNERSWRSWGDFHSDTSAYYLMIDGLLQRGLRVDGIGLQYHLFKLLHELDDALPTFLNPAHVLAVLDQYADYRRPIHISEITIPAGSEGDDGEQIQAELARGLYRLWFSHPAVEAIVWWNLADGKLWGDEGRFKGGLLREDLTAKPTYEALDEVINHEWKTQVQVTTGADGIARFRGFGGKYELRAEGCPPQQAHIRPGFGNEVTIHLA
jgi:GH35 family endo-1,4-beta-xylanase